MVIRPKNLKSFCCGLSVLLVFLYLIVLRVFATHVLSNWWRSLHNLLVLFYLHVFSEVAARWTLSATLFLSFKLPQPQSVTVYCSGCVFTVCVCSLLCVHFGWVNAEHKFRVWVTIHGCMSRHFHFHFHFHCNSLQHLQLIKILL